MKLNVAIDNFLKSVLIFKSSGTYKFYVSHLRYLDSYFSFYDIDYITDDLKYNYLIPYLKVCNSNFLFTLTASGVSSLFNRVNEKLKFKKFSPHMLRHTYATILVNNNTNLEFIRKTLGHSSLTVTKKYLHCNQEELFKVYKNNFKI